MTADANKTPAKDDNTATSTTPFVAVAGAGHWGQNLIRNFYELGSLKAICETSAARREEVASRYPGVRVVADLEEVLRDPEIKGVVLATPAPTHYALAKKSLLAGKDVLVEKPLCLSPDGGEELCCLAEEKGLILMVGHLLHYHPAVQELKKIVAQGGLGRLHHIHSARLNLGIFRFEENVLWSFAPHDISVALAVAGETPKRMMAAGTATLTPGIHDTAHLTMEFSGGLLAHIFVSWLYPVKEQRLVLAGEGGMLVFDDTAEENKLRYYPNPVKWSGTKPAPDRKEMLPVPVAAAEPLRAECEAFLKAIETRIPPPSDGREGLAVLKVLAAAQRSLEQGGIWVEIKEERVKTEETEMRAAEGNRTRPSRENEAQPSEEKKYFAHPTAVIDEGCKIGAGTKIWHFSHIMSGAEIGERCNIGQNVFIAPGVKIGNGVKIQNNVSVYTGVICEDDVFLGPSMVFTNVLNPRSFIERKDEYLPTLVKRGATIGANATIVCGHTIGDYAFVAAGAVVTKDVPPHALVAGNPARITGWVCKCGVRVKNTVAQKGNESIKWKCAACGEAMNCLFK